MALESAVLSEVGESTGEMNFFFRNARKLLLAKAYSVTKAVKMDVFLPVYFL
jgi:hypothetical protein